MTRTDKDTLAPATLTLLFGSFATCSIHCWCGCRALYKNTLKQYLDNKYVVDSTGFKVNCHGLPKVDLAAISQHQFTAVTVSAGETQHMAPQCDLAAHQQITAGSIAVAPA